MLILKYLSFNVEEFVNAGFVKPHDYFPVNIGLGYAHLPAAFNKFIGGPLVARNINVGIAYPVDF